MFTSYLRVHLNRKTRRTFENEKTNIFLRARVLKPNDRITLAKQKTSARISLNAQCSKHLKQRSCRDEKSCSI